MDLEPKEFKFDLDYGRLLPSIIASVVDGRGLQRLVSALRQVRAPVTLTPECCYQLADAIDKDKLRKIGAPSVNRTGKHDEKCSTYLDFKGDDDLCKEFGLSGSDESILEFINNRTGGIFGPEIDLDTLRRALGKKKRKAVKKTKALPGTLKTKDE